MAFADCAIAGGTAGVFVEAALYPIDTIKTRLQVGWLSTTFFFLVYSFYCQF